MKKFGVFVFLSLLLVSSFVSFASAQEILRPVADAADSFYSTVVEPFAKFLLGKNGAESAEIFFAKILIFLLLASMVWYAADSFPPTQGKRALLVAVIISALSVRFLSATWVETIALPYTAFGIAVSALIPLILFFFFVETGLQGQPVLRKICWIFAAVIFVGLFLYRYDAPFVGSNDKGIEPGHMYLIASLLSLGLLFWDKTIQRAFIKGKYERMNEIRGIRTRSDLIEEYEKVRERMAKGSITNENASVLIKSIRARAKANGLEQEIFELPG